jgi:multisubunit Na+/H+ antiporter MnhC subunit
MSAFAVNVVLAGALGLVAIGIAGVVVSRNLFRIVLALSIAESGANLLLVLVGFRHDAIAPIIEVGRTAAGTAMVDPIPQAMVLTSIVIGVGVQALALAMAIRARAGYGSLDLHVLCARMEDDITAAAGAAAGASQEGPAGGRPLPPPFAGAPPRLPDQREPRP